MDFDEMCDIRDAWISKEAANIIDSLLGRAASEWLEGLLTPRAGFLDELGVAKALTLTYIAARDLRADSAEEIAERLVSRELVHPIDLEMLVESLVKPVVLAVRTGRFPTSTLGAIDEHHALFLNIWAAQQSLAHSVDGIRQKLIELWDVQDEAMLDLLATGVRYPYVLLPSDLLELSPTGHLALIARNDRIRQNITLGMDKWLGDHPAAHMGRPDLLEVARLIRIRQRFGALHERECARLSVEVREAVERDFRCWDEQWCEFAMALTEYEVWLLTQADEDDLYRHKAMSAGASSGPESTPIVELPTRADLAKPPQPAPSWIVDAVVAEGARNWHRRVGSYPVWLTTAETHLNETLLRRLLNDNDRWTIGQSQHDEVFTLYLFVPDDSDDGDLELSFAYPLTSIKHTWELLHLGMAGHVRLTLLRITDVGEVTVAGAVAVPLPEELYSTIRETATQSLRDLICDDMDAIRYAFTNYDPARTSVKAFMLCENAKAEDLTDELHESLPADASAEQWTRFCNASRTTAALRAQLGEALLDGRETESLRSSLMDATGERERAREVARARSRRKETTDELASLAALLPDDKTTFVHLNIVDEKLYAVCLSRQNGDPLIEMHYLRVPVRSLREIGAAWASAALRERIAMARHESAGFRALCEAAQGIVSAVPNGTERVILSPVPPLDQLPTHAVPILPGQGDECMLDVFDEVVHAPTLRLISHINERERGSGSPVLISHSGTGIPGFKPLSGPALETHALAALYPDAQLITEQFASRDTALRAMTGARIANFSGHAYTDSSRWADGLVMEGSTLGNSVLTSGHVLAHTSLKGIDLLTLNGCRTSGNTTKGAAVHTLRGLDGAFLARGVRAVISTMWEVYDPCALVFSILLHGGISKGMPPIRAYHRALHYLRNSGWRNLYVSLDEAPECFLQAFLDAHRPAWRTELHRYGTDHLAVWGAFKITGLAWRHWDSHQD